MPIAALCKCYTLSAERIGEQFPFTKELLMKKSQSMSYWFL